MLLELFVSGAFPPKTQPCLHHHCAFSSWPNPCMALKIRVFGTLSFFLISLRNRTLHRKGDQSETLLLFALFYQSTPSSIKGRGGKWECAGGYLAVHLVIFGTFLPEHSFMLKS